MTWDARLKTSDGSWTAADLRPAVCCVWATDSSLSVYPDQTIASFITDHCWLDKQSCLTEKLRCCKHDVCVHCSLLYLLRRRTQETDVLRLHHSTEGRLTSPRHCVVFPTITNLQIHFTFQFLSVFPHQMFACAKSLFISDQDKRKHFCLLLRLFLGHRQEVGSFQSRMIKVISKPSQKRQSMKNADRESCSCTVKPEIIHTPGKFWLNFDLKLL